MIHAGAEILDDEWRDSIFIRTKRAIACEQVQKQRQVIGLDLLKASFPKQIPDYVGAVSVPRSRSSSALVCLRTRYFVAPVQHDKTAHLVYITFLLCNI